MTPVLVAVMGQTGSGKSKLAEALATELDAALLNADAFQVYRGLDIGTNKPQRRDLYALLDLVEPTELFGLGQWLHLAVDELNRNWAQQRSVVVVGGTGLYVRALMQQYSEIHPAPSPDLRDSLTKKLEEKGLAALAEDLLRLDPQTKVDLQNPARVRRALEKVMSACETVRFQIPPYVQTKLSTNPDLQSLEALFETRVHHMLSCGWRGEVERLIGNGVPPTSPGFRAIGYQSLAGHIRGEMDLDSTVADIVTKTRQYAKRQRTWLRSEPELLQLPLTRPNDEGQTQAQLSAARLMIRRGAKK